MENQFFKVYWVPLENIKLAPSFAVMLSRFLECLRKHCWGENNVNFVGVLLETNPAVNTLDDVQSSLFRALDIQPHEQRTEGDALEGELVRKRRNNA